MAKSKPLLRFIRKVQPAGFRLTRYEKEALESICGTTGELRVKLVDLDEEEGYGTIKAVLTGGRVRLVDPVKLSKGATCLVEVHEAWPRPKWERV